MKWLMICALALIPLDALALGPAKSCFRQGGESEDTCAISLSTLIARGEDFDGKVVLVIGFYAFADTPMLFTSHDGFLSSDAADAVDIILPKAGPLAQKLDSVDHQYVQIKGRYRATATDVTGYGGFRTGGTITEIRGVGARANLPWGYSLPRPYDARKK
jgi:hypothetical protein